ncbi:protein DDB_G0276689-like isoform X2 [Coccinella septempunctata]|uniref:protein DDB_G0276689-like isoform X1 n=1 Tax=Coccinella septempunctata TaxID=41139 RepID=UPI001D070A16|nr:protein DDB_G0276689-like isoform X1 [Coccinella septempunctata]XP_044746403.1 protein DDB_G0276689-like isoform X2 [Coccinella septempunctata]
MKKYFNSQVNPLFKAPKKYALAHCVSKDFHMNKGIALTFKQKYEGINELKSQNKSTGEVAFINRDNRNIYYLITKEFYYEKPKYETVFKALIDLRKLCENNNEKYLALPRIACGLDQLEWSIIFKMIQFIFMHSNVNIMIYNIRSKKKKEVNNKNTDFNGIEYEEFMKLIKEATYEEVDEDELASMINQVTEEELDECLELLNAHDKNTNNSNQNINNDNNEGTHSNENYNNDDNIENDSNQDNDDENDDFTVHSNVENPILELPYTERCLNAYPLQIIFKIASNYNVTKTKLFGDKIRFRVLINSIDNDLFKFIKEYVRPEKPYTIYF